MWLACLHLSLRPLFVGGAIQILITDQLSPVLTVPTHEGMARLSGQLHTKVGCLPDHRWSSKTGPDVEKLG